MAAAESGRLYGLGKIMCFPECRAPPDLMVRPSQLIAEPVEVRMADDWSEPKNGLNVGFAKPEVGDSGTGLAGLRLAVVSVTAPRAFPAGQAPGLGPAGGLPVSNPLALARLQGGTTGTTGKC